MNYKKRFDPNSVTEEELLDELKLLAEKLGKVPSRTDMQNGTPMTKRLYLYGRKFGGLTQACEKAGLVANKGGKYAKYDEQELLDYIIELSTRLNRTPTQKDIDAEGRYASGAYKRHFGTYNKALKALGLKRNTNYDATKEEIIDDVIRVAKKLGRSPKAREFDNMSNTVSCVSASQKLGLGKSWNKLLKECGLKVINHRNIPNKDLKEEVARLEAELNRIPGYYDMLQLGYYSPETYADRFGSYTNALKEFGYDYIPQSQWHNQTYTEGKDGTLYKSKFEANIADALFYLKSKAKITSYKYERKVCADRNWTCDFYITIGKKEIWLEADGMGKNRNDPYEIENEKISFYNKNGFKYFIIPYKKMNLKKYIQNILL